MRKNILVVVPFLFALLMFSGLTQATSFPDKDLYDSAEEDWGTGKMDQAYEKLNKLIEAYQDSPYIGKAHLKRALYLKSKHEYMEAIKENKKVLEKFPGTYDAAEAQGRIGCIYNVIGDGENALKYYKKALQEAKDWQQVKYSAAWARRLHFNQERFQARLCGPKSLARVMEYFGKTVALEEITPRLADKEEVSLYDLAKLADEYGLNARGVKLDPKQKLGDLVPILIHMPPYHFSVITKMDEKGATIFDPSAGLLDYSVDELCRRWNGEGLVFAEAPTTDRTAYLDDEIMKSLKGSYCNCCPGNDDDDDEEGDDGDDKDGPCGYPRVTVKVNTLNLRLYDTPIWYDAGKGLPMKFQIAYSHDNSNTSAVGNSWYYAYGMYLTKTGYKADIVYPNGNLKEFYDYSYGSGTNWAPYYSYEGIHDMLSQSGNKFTLETFPEHVKYFFADTANSTRRLTAIEDQWGNKQSMYYDANDHLTRVEDPNGDAFNLYLDSGNDYVITKVARPDGKNATFYYTADNKLTKIIDMAGAVTTLVYNSYNYVTSMTSPVGGGATWNFATDSSEYRNVTKITDPLSNVRLYEHFISGTYNNITDPNGHVVRYQWDNYNNTTAIRYYYNANDYYVLLRMYEYTRNLTKVVDQNGRTTVYYYGSKGLVTKMTDALGNSTDYYFNPSTYDLTKEKYKSNETYFYYGTQHEVTRTVYPDGTEEKFYFDTNGKQTKFTDQRGNSMEFLYDSKGYLTKSISAEGKTIAYFNDSLGKRLTMVDGDTNATCYSYDDMDRITRITHPDSNTSDYFYSCCTLTKVKDANGKETVYFYDKMNRLLTVVDALTNATIYRYDGVGNLTKMTDAKNCNTIYVYDPLNRMTKTTFADENCSVYGYDGIGNLTSEVDAAGKRANYYYNAINRLTRIGYQSAQ